MPPRQASIYDGTINYTCKGVALRGNKPLCGNIKTISIEICAKLFRDRFLHLPPPLCRTRLYKKKPTPDSHWTQQPSPMHTKHPLGHLEGLRASARPLSPFHASDLHLRARTSYGYSTDKLSLMPWKTYPPLREPATRKS